MPQGLKAWDQNGTVILDTSYRVSRVIYAGPVNASGIADTTWTTVVPTAQASQLWAVAIYTGSNSSLPTNQLYYKEVKITIDPASQPGKIFLSGSWFDAQAGVMKPASDPASPYNNSILIYGIY